MQTYRQHVETTALKCKKGLSVLKAIAAMGIEQNHLFLPYQSVVFIITDYGLRFTIEPMLDLPPMQTRQKVEQIKAYFSAFGNPTTHSMKL